MDTLDEGSANNIRRIAGLGDLDPSITNEARKAGKPKKTFNRKKVAGLVDKAWEFRSIPKSYSDQKSQLQDIWSDIQTEMGVSGVTFDYFLSVLDRLRNDGVSVDDVIASVMIQSVVDTIDKKTKQDKAMGLAVKFKAKAESVSAPRLSRTSIFKDGV